MSITVLRQLLMKEAVKKSAGSSGIMSINKNIAADVDKLLQKYINDAMQQGVDIETLSPDQLKMIVAINSKPTNRVISGSSAEGKAITEKLFGKKGEVVEFPQPKTFKQEIDAMKKSGDLVDEDNMVISKKITDREMFKNSNLNKPTVEGQMEKINKASNRIDEIKKEQAAMYKPKVDTVEETVTYIKTLEPMTAMKEANLVIGRKGKYKDLTPEESKKILQDTEDHIFERDIPIDPEDMASGGRAGFYTGGITDVEPSLDDIGHGSDALMARTRLMSPGAQATTSTGLNYLLAEDNDNMRIPFAGGGDPKRRAFLKLLATLTGGAAAFKSGLLSLGEGGAKKAVSETVKQAAGSGGQVPPYFLKLVDKIKTMGDDVTAVLAYKDKQKVTKYKDYELTEDLTTGEQTIQRMKVLDDDSASYYGNPLTEETYMSYKPGKGQADETMKGKTPPDEYEEGTALLRSDREYAGEVVDEMSGISDDVFKEVGEEVPEAIRKTKADGGRIGFSGGGIFRAIIAKSAAKKGMTVTDFIKATNYKNLPSEVKMYISADEFAKLKGGQQDLYENFIDMAKTRKSFQENVEAGKKGPASPLFENLEKTMDEQSFVPKTVTADDIAQMELMVKNRFNKGRKDNAQGGLQTMLGE